jgi:hypothetical protein
MKYLLPKGAVDQTIQIFIQDSGSTTGAGKTGIAYNAAGLTAHYSRPRSTPAAITLATQTVTGAHSDGGFVEVDATNLPGVYRLDLPDAVLASGVDTVVVMLKGATGMAPLVLEIQLTNLNVNDGVRAGLTALPNAAADAAGGLPISDAGGLDLDARLDAAVSSRATPAQVATELATYDGPTKAELDAAVAPLATAAQASAIEVDTQDLQTRIGTPAGASIAADIATRASSSEVTAIQNNTRVVRVVPTVMERPDAGAGSLVYRVEALLYDAVGNMEAPDSAPTMDVVNQAGTSRNANLDSTTGALVSTGRYRWLYTVPEAHALEQLVFTLSVVEGGVTRAYGNTTLVVDTTAVDFTAADRAKLDAIEARATEARLSELDSTAGKLAHDVATVLLTDRLTAGRAGNLDSLDTTVSSRATGAQASAIEADTQDIQSRLPAALVGGRIAANAEVVGDKTGYALTAGERTAIVTALYAAAAEGPETYIEMLRLMRAALVGKSSGHELGTPKYRDRADTKDRISATTDANGNRTTVTTDGA